MMQADDTGAQAVEDEPTYRTAQQAGRAAMTFANGKALSVKLTFPFGTQALACQ